MDKYGIGDFMHKVISELDQSTDLSIYKEEQIRILQAFSKDLDALLTAAKEWQVDVENKNENS